MNSTEEFIGKLIFKTKDFFQTQPEILVALVTNMFIAICIVISSFLVLKFLNRVIKKLNINHLPSPFLPFLQSFLKWCILVGAFLLILQQIGFKLNSLWTVISTVMAMVAIGFVAVWSILSNFLCTVMLIAFHPFKIGDHIEIIDPAMTVGLGGKVKNINFMFTSIDSERGESDIATSIQVPNNLFFQKIIRKTTGSETINLEQQLFEKRSLCPSEKKDCI